MSDYLKISIDLIKCIGVLVGGPCSGKTSLANKLKDYIVNDKKKKVTIVNEEYFSLNKEEFYKDSNTEKMLRAKLKSECEKMLDDNDIIILDSLNYIKGYRYELFCLVRNFKTRHCIVYLKTEIEVCLKLNEANKTPDYSENLLQDLYSRMEIPNQNNRWDNPTFELYFDDKIPFEDIFGCLYEGKRSRDPVVSKGETPFESNFLHELDTVCTDITNEILNNQKVDSVGEAIKITDNNFLFLKKVFSALELKKLKQEFIKLVKLHPPKNKQEMIKCFVEFINGCQDRY